MKFKFRKRVKMFFLGLSITVFFSSIYLFFFGCLNFLNPWIIGFEKHETERATIYYHSEQVDINCLLDIDSLISMVESFHSLKFKEKVDLVICNNLKEQKKYTLHDASFVTLPIKGRVYVRYNKDYFSSKASYLHSYVRHELSHSIINQNTPISVYIGYPLWFLEGIATYSSNMMGLEGYPSADEIKVRISKGHFIYPKDWGNFGLAKKGPSVVNYKQKDLYWFAYSEFAYLIDDLIKRYGEPHVIQLLHNSLLENDFDKVFEAEYQITFDKYLDVVKEELVSDITTSMNLHSKY